MVGIKTAAAAKRELKNILNRHIIGEQIAAGQYVDLEAWLFNLPKFARHRGCSFTIKMASAYGGRRVKALHIITAKSNFALPVFASQLSAPGSKAKQLKHTRAAVISALREAVKYQIDEYRAYHKALRASLPNGSETLKILMLCPLTGKRLCGRAHVDHVGRPFIEISDNWLIANKFKSYTDVDLKRGQLSEPLLSSWQEWHKKYAILQLVSARANIAKGSSGYISKFKD